MQWEQPWNTMLRCLSTSSSPCHTNEDLTVKMSEGGGGVPLRKTDRLFNYVYSTAPWPRVQTPQVLPWLVLAVDCPSPLCMQALPRRPQAVFPWGLWDMQWSTKALSTQLIERLPAYNKDAWKHYNVHHEADEWCVPSREPKDITMFHSAQIHLGLLGNPNVAFVLHLEGMVFGTILY